MGKIKLAIYLLCALLLVTVVYNVVDNYRFKIVEQTVVLERLPPAFAGFRILQITDLHGRTFGEKQARLLEAINSLEYDMIAFTGDMNRSDTLNAPVAESQAILDLLDGLQNKEWLFWIDGNTGPYAVESVEGAHTGRLTPIGQLLQEKGCHVLLAPYPIRRGEQQIWITPALSEMGLSIYSSLYLSEGAGLLQEKEQVDNVGAYYETINEAFHSLKGNGEMKILLEHVPLQMDLSAAELGSLGHLDYDLILAGHYHGGQWRLPFLGALYVPAPTAGLNGGGFFPRQQQVKGLARSGDVPQYISAGLGASGHDWWTDFRLFNTPELNLIILERE